MSGGPTDDDESSPCTRRSSLEGPPSLHLDRRPPSDAGGPELSTVPPYGDGRRLLIDKDAAE